jgi:adenylate cyclase
MLVLGFVVAYLVSWRLTRRIEALDIGTREVARGNYALRLNVTGTDEIGRLVESFNTMASGLEERERIKATLDKMVDPDVARRLLKDEHKLHGEEIESAVLFCDLRNYTSLSESLAPDHLLEFLNEYLALLVDAVQANGGVVDKFIGDAIMAHWGAVEPDPDATQKAIDTALMFRSSLAEYNQRNTTRSGYKKPMARIGVGINTGPVLVGLIGSEKRQEFTVIGDQVNLASRVESVSKHFNCDILISQNSYNKVKRLYRVEYLPSVQIKGKGRPQNVYAVLGHMEDINCPDTLEELQKYRLLFDPDRRKRKRHKPDLSREYVVTFRD